MFEQLRGDKDFDSTGFIFFLHKWRKPLFFLSVLALILSVVFSSSWFITPKYKSVVIMYPTSTSSISKALLTETAGEKQDILEFGEDEQAEQMLQILNSNRIRDRVIDKYDLMDHYGISPDEKFRFTKLYQEYENNISFKRTEFMAVRITVMDRDPEMAADMANDIADLLDSTKNAIQKERAIRALKIVEAEYIQLRDEIQAMEDSLTRLRELGVHDYESQAEMINQQLAIELARGNQGAVKALELKLETLAKYGGPYVSIRDALEYEKKQFSQLKAKYEEAKVDAEEVLPQKFVVSYAYPAEKKAYPIRWIIVLVTLTSTVILTLLILALYESISGLEPDKKKSPDGGGVLPRGTPGDGSGRG
ncbi:MAG: hypothetical protein JW861_09615 [Bacteroidales bacterium]|nr:hypothetical protein [Bacteroidales bacterium]